VKVSTKLEDAVQTAGISLLVALIASVVTLAFGLDRQWPTRIRSRRCQCGVLVVHGMGTDSHRNFCMAAAFGRQVFPASVVPKCLHRCFAYCELSVQHIGIQRRGSES
jgi:hypothetical protein